MCGTSGYPGGSWTLQHERHEECPVCGKVQSESGMPTHLAKAHQTNRRKVGRGRFVPLDDPKRHA
jgi:hypothetical protein